MTKDDEGMRLALIRSLPYSTVSTPGDNTGRSLAVLAAAAAVAAAAIVC